MIPDRSLVSVLKSGQWFVHTVHLLFEIRFVYRVEIGHFSRRGLLACSHAVFRGLLFTITIQKNTPTKKMHLYFRWAF